MNVPNHDKVPFKDMTPEERSAIVESTLKGNTVLFDTEEWRPAASNFIVLDAIYRTKPRQLIIPWEHIKPEYKWAAMDVDGFVVLATFKLAQRNDGVWVCMDGKMADVVALNIDTTGIDWRDSLVQRPEGV